MRAVTINLRDDMYRDLLLAAKDNGRSMTYEIVCRVAETMSTAAKARRAKMAILGASRTDALAFARAHGWKRDQWFYAYSIDGVTGRLVRGIVSTGAYKPRRNHDAIMRQLCAGELAAKAYAAQ